MIGKLDLIIGPMFSWKTDEPRQIPAYYTQRFTNGETSHYDEPTLLIGGSESYEARCILHHIVPRRPKKYF